jgi:hypothetical protein
MDHPAAHRDGVSQDFISDAELLERVDAPCGKGEIDRPAADEISGPRIRAPLIQLHLIAAPAEVSGQEPTCQTATNQDKLRSHENEIDRINRINRIVLKVIRLNPVNSL